MATIRRADVRDFWRALSTAGHRCWRIVSLALVRKMLNFAIDQEWIDANPAANMARPAVETGPIARPDTGRIANRLSMSLERYAREDLDATEAPALDATSGRAPIAPVDGTAGRGSDRDAMARHPRRLVDDSGRALEKQNAPPCTADTRGARRAQDIEG